MNARKTEKTKNKKILRVAMMFFAMIMVSIAVVGCTPNVLKKKAFPKPSKVIVSLGDSYSSGEGIEPFYDQNASNEQKAESQDWLAHRSQNSWPGMLTLSDGGGTMAEHRGSNWFFAAASGAEIKHMLGSQKKEYDFQNDLSFKKSKDLSPQLNIFESMGGKKADYVTLTLSGNDVGFEKIITAGTKIPEFLKPGNLSDLLDNALDRFDGNMEVKGTEIPTTVRTGEGIRDDLNKAYKDIARKAGNDAKIIVAGYPTLLSEETDIKSFFSTENAKMINEAVIKFNRKIEREVSICKAEGMEIYFVSVEEAFAGKEAYSSGVSYINKVMVTQPEDLTMNFPPTSAYSIHPNLEGAKAYAKCVQKKINELEKEQERDVVLTLDVSGSMAGEPLEETKKASSNFINTILKRDASVGIVAYDDMAMRLSDFNTDERYLTNIVQGISDGGGTNIEAGLAEAYNMLQVSNSDKKIIVLMSDGEPNEGKVGGELIDFADEIKSDGVSIYTLGFFGDIGNKSSAQALMERIASDGCHYEVANANDLVFFFGDVADQLNGQKYTYVRIACPVDVSVSHKGETLNSSEDNFCARTDFGTLTFEENEEPSDDRIKILRLKDGIDYDVHIEGTGRGTMDYTIGFTDENGQYSDLRKFRNIPITKRTIIDTVAKSSKTTVLNVDKNGDGKYDEKYRAKENGRGKIVDYTYLYYIAGGVTALILLFMVVMIIKRKFQKDNL